MNTYKFPLNKQQEIFLGIVQKNSVIKTILDNGFIDGILDWYLVAGCLNQTIWNYQTENNVQQGIKDYDLVYFDKDTSAKKETQIQNKVREKYKELKVDLDVVNQARVHIWIEKEWDLKMRPLVSTEDAIASWPATVACIGVRKEKDNYIIAAPYGLTDNLEMIIRPNKTTVMRESDFNFKANKWKAMWPQLTVIPW